jgi:hypothetical protein
VLSIVNNLNPADILTATVCGLISIIFIGCSAIISSSENAFFSLTKIQIELVIYSAIQKNY